MRDQGEGKEHHKGNVGAQVRAVAEDAPFGQTELEGTVCVWAKVNKNRLVHFV